ncbi:MAG: GGDEF domain-containing protein [Deltaproteobacteria bacterium]|nr:GGDEF domain-containing protein [Deltaproteobacteria bacterium]
MDEKDFYNLEEECEEDDGDRTVIQGIKNLTAKLESRRASLMVISGQSAGKMFPIGSVDYIGRSKDCEIFLNDEGISRRHARIEVDETGDVYISDLNSTNGTYFNGVRITRHLLQDGDKIQIGSTTILKFSFQDSIEESFHQNQYEQAVRDGLTGIYNKKRFMEQLRSDFSYALRHGEITSLIMFDLDHFKQVNDTYGHAAGDMVLRTMAEVVSATLRDEDFFARYGGEEFAVILRAQDAKRAYVAAERVRRSVETHKFMWDGRRIPVTISLGVATLERANYHNPHEMLEEADSYLYKSKHAGRNRTSSSLRE